MFRFQTFAARVDQQPEVCQSIGTQQIIVLRAKNYPAGQLPLPDGDTRLAYIVFYLPPVGKPEPHCRWEAMPISVSRADGSMV